MNRFFYRALSLCMALLFCFGIVSCDKNDIENDTGNDTTATTEAETAVSESKVKPKYLITADELWSNATTKDSFIKLHSNRIMDAKLMADGKYVALLGSGEDMYVAAIVPGGAVEVGRYLAMKYRTNEDCGGEFFLGSGSGWTGAGDCLAIDYVSDGEWQLLIVDLESVASVQNNFLNYLRVDCFTDGTNRTMDIAYIAFFDSEEDAKQYDADQGYEDIPYEDVFDRENYQPSVEPSVEFLFSLTRDESGYRIMRINSNGVSNLEIPATYEGLPVVSISGQAFTGDSTTMKSLSLPDSITGISSDFLSQFVNLETLKCPATVAPAVSEMPALKEVYCSGTVSDWLINGGGYLGENCTIHCSDGDVTADMIPKDFKGLFRAYYDYGILTTYFLRDVESLARYAKAYEEYTKTGINYNEYEKYSEADQGSHEAKLYQQYLDFKTAQSQYSTAKNRRLNDLVNIHNCLSTIETSGCDAQSLIDEFSKEYLPILLDAYDCTLEFESGKEGDLSAVTNLEKLPQELQDNLYYYVRLTKSSYIKTLKEVQEQFQETINVLVKPGWVSMEEIREKIG